MQAPSRSSVKNRPHLQAGRRWRHCFAAAGLAATLWAGIATPAPAQSIVVIVNGLPITTYDIDQRTRLIRVSTRKSPTRQQVIDEIINEKVKLREAQRWGVQVSDADVDNAFAGMARGMGIDGQQLAQALAQQDVDAKSLKARIRADLAWNHLVRGRYQASLQVGDRDIQSMLDRQQEERKEAVGYEYTLRPILFIVPQGSSPSLMAARRREAEALRSRFQSCNEGIAFARALRDVAVRAPIVRVSADLPAPFRTLLNELEIGRLTTPEITAQGVQVFALCDRKTTTGDTPQQKAARTQIFAKKFEEQSKLYLERIRRSAMIEYKSEVR